jgi:cytoplasmic iron level regulating protein YaaA (DUF328/UPF0246 family)
MLFIISPAKSFDFDSKIFPPNASVPVFLHEISELLSQIKKLSAQDLIKLMKISNNLADLNVKRYQDFDINFNAKNSKPAIAVFDGDVYRAMQPLGFNKSDLEFAQSHLRILSGFYGILKPLDLIQAYRLEMGIKLKNNSGKNLYEFWHEKITNFLNNEVS